MTNVGRQLRALDILGLTLMILIIVGCIGFLFGLRGSEALAVPLFGLVRSFGLDFVLPMLRSRRARPEETDNPIFEGLSVRVSNRLPTHVIRGFFKDRVVVKAIDLENVEGAGRAIVLHEKGHIRYGDLRYFTLVSALGDAARFSVAVTVAEVFLRLPAATGQVFTPSQTVAIVLMCFIAAMPVFALAKRSLHLREFRADSYAANQAPDLTLDWLENNIYREKTRTAWSKFWLGSNFTHPSFEQRFLVCQEGRIPRTSLISSVFFTLYYTFLGIGLTLLLVAAGMGIEEDQTARPYIAWAVGLCALPAIALGPTYLSVEVGRLANELGKAAALALAVSYAIILFMAVLAFTAMHQANSVTPQSEFFLTSFNFFTDVLPIAAVFLAYGGTVWVGNMVISKWRLDYLISHVVIGCGAWMIAFPAIGFVYRLLFL